MSAPVRLREAKANSALVRAEDGPGVLNSLRTLARAMLTLTEDEVPSAAEPATREDRRRLEMLARQISAQRLRRAQFFSSDLFGEPAWDILLDLFAASKANELRSIKSACLSSRAPEATALRYIDQLVAHGLVERKPDKTDRRRKYLSLTPLGERKMHDFLASMPPIGDQGEDLIRYLVLAS